MGILLTGLALAALLLGIAVAILPGRPWSIREVLEADTGAGAEDLSDVTVLIPARDEARVIGWTISSVREQGRGVSVVLVDDGSTDGTVERAREAAGEGLRIVRGEPLPDGWSGKLWALEQGRKRVHTAYTLLLDADILLSPGTIGTLRRKSRTDGIPFLSLMAAPSLGSFWERLLMPAFVFFFKVLYPFRLANSPTSRVAAAAGGCILAETRLLESIGGFGPIRDALIDDCALAHRVKASGSGTWIGLTRSVRSIRPYGGLMPIWEMVARNAYTQLRYSVTRLGGCTLAMVVAFWVPPIGLFAPSPAARALSAVALIAMTLLYLPTVRFYRGSLVWALGLPLAGTLFLAMTWTSAARNWKGDRSRWKGRVYGSPRFK